MEKLKDMFQKTTLLLSLTALTLFFVPLATAATCSSDTLADYIANGSCTLGDLSFTSITGSASATLTDLSTSGITVAPITTPSDPGLQFGDSFDAVGKERNQTMTVSFTVSDTTNSLIDDIGIAFDAGYTGKGTAELIETYCNAAFANLSGFNSSGCGTFSVTNPGANYSTTLILPTAVSSLEVTKELIFKTNGTGLGDTADTAYGSFGASTFDPVPTPEPRSVSLLLGLGLLAGVIIARRVQAARA
ncbi:MAG TPA: hypothetical protein VMB25_24650 [Bryobacteraceae bacterium]|nr:hypothetical protein [Bryobacteraceae bacterium]